MHHPYAQQPGLALAAAQAATAVAVATRLVYAGDRGMGPRVAGLVLAGLFPFTGHPLLLLLAAGAASALAMLVVARRRLAFAALAAHALLGALSVLCVGFERDLSVLATVVQTLLIALLDVPNDPAPTRAAAGWTDALLFGFATATAAFVSELVFARTSIMDDEWAYTFQADLFAHGRAFAGVFPCASPFDNSWLYAHDGRTFSQFTPGWPLFMAPFVRLGLAWLASPVALGLLLMAVARLGRRLGSGAPQRTGLLAAVMAGAGASVLLNAGSRFSHVFVAAMFAWSVEAASALLAAPGRRSALALGTCLAAMSSARPTDGVLLASGIVLVLAVAAWRGSVPKRELAVAGATFTGWMALTLGILRAQLGVWFQTGYALTDVLRPWAKLVIDLPARDQWTYALPLAAGTYCWWPCSIALGVGGLTLARRARPLVSMLAIGTLALLAFYVFVDFARLRYWAYGPRYQLPVVVALSVGGAVWLSPLLARRWSALMVTVSFAGALLAIAAQLYPAAQREAHARSAVFRAIARERVHHAVVWVGQGELSSHPSALTQNLASDLDADVIILARRSHADVACARERYPDRRFYRALGLGEVTLVPD
ncbi:MAG TPA: hypothetical protein VI299_22280 [Polyangiales bacterium]